MGYSGRLQFELIQTTLFGINVGMPGWMMRLGCLIGDVDLIK